MMKAGNRLEDTIVAQATPQGRGAIGIVRLSGERAVEIASRIVKETSIVSEAVPRRFFLVNLLHDDGSPLDKALCVTFRKPHSYTGENLVEFHLHGSSYIASMTVERCCREGARTAEPGEFTLRAFLNGRMDLAQAEAVADVVAADSVLSHRAAVLQREGNLSRRIRQIRSTLMEVCGAAELEIDFSDQDLPVLDRRRALLQLQEIETELRDLEASFERGRLAREGATVVIAGAPNVGKSTLFNALLGEDRAIVHELPGTTRDAVEAVTEWGGLSIRLVDSAGLAEDFDGPDREAVRRARHAARSADVLLWVIDLTQTEAVVAPAELEEKTLLIGNKADLVAAKKQQRSAILLKISALKGQGLDKTQVAALKKLLPAGECRLSDGVLTRERHLEAVRRSLLSLLNAKRVLESDLGDELLAEDLKDAADMLGEIVGEITPDDVLNKIFSDFCIGK